MSHSSPSRYLLRVADLPQRTKTKCDVRPDAHETEELRSILDLLELRKAVMTGFVAPVGKHDWKLTAHLGATVVQPCVATLEPVTTRVETDITRHFVKVFDVPTEPEAEIPEDDTTEPLGAHIDLWAILTEALSLALPLYPRAQTAADPVELRVTAPGSEPMSDDAAKPFAALAALKAQLDPPGDTES